MRDAHTLGARRFPCGGDVFWNAWSWDANAEIIEKTWKQDSPYTSTTGIIIILPSSYVVCAGPSSRVVSSLPTSLRLLSLGWRLQLACGACL